MSIFDLITVGEIVAYYEMKTQNDPPFMGEELFPNDKKMGLKLQWIKGASGMPVVLKPSAYDVAAIPRPRIGFEKLETQMPFFKESKYIDEELRQDLNKVLATANQVYIDLILKKIFDDETELLVGAAAQRERMRMMMLTTGLISIEGNGQIYDYDYHMPEDHKSTVRVSWSNPAATILDDIQAAVEKIFDDTGVTVTRAICSKKVLGYMRKNEEIKITMRPATNGEGHISNKDILKFIEDELDIKIVTNDFKYKDETGKEQRYVAEDVFCLFPEGKLGNTWFGVTPEESDLATMNEIANVAVTDTGVAVTTMAKADPVNIETKVTMVCLPDFPTADQVYILDILAE